MFEFCEIPHRIFVLFFVVFFIVFVLIVMHLAFGCCKSCDNDFTLNMLMVFYIVQCCTFWQLRNGVRLVGDSTWTWQPQTQNVAQRVQSKMSSPFSCPPIEQSVCLERVLFSWNYSLFGSNAKLHLLFIFILNRTLNHIKTHKPKLELK